VTLNGECIMKWTEDDIKDRIAEIEKDSRYLIGLISPASYQINAPLAFVQMAFESEIQTLRKVLGGHYTTLTEKTKLGEINLGIGGTVNG